MSFKFSRSPRIWNFIFGLLILPSVLAHATLWTTGYYPGWEQAGMPPANIDFTTLSHVIHFSVVPNSDGTLDPNANSITSANSTALINRAHSLGKKVIICVGGADTESLFQSATSSANLPTFINSLTNFMASRGYDGVDIDWEPCPSADAPQYKNFVNGLRTALNQFSQHKLITVAAGAYPPYGDSPTGEYAMYASLQSAIDQVNVMVYDLSGAYDGWVTWFNSPIYDGNFHFPNTTELVPSLDASINNFITNGLAPAKIGISIAFYGYVWTHGSGTSSSSITQPRQSWTVAPTVTAIRYSDVISSYYQSNLYHWDTNAQAAYIGITNSNPTNNVFLSYDDPRTVQAKVSYARNHALGGLMIWELAQDHVGSTVSPLTQALKSALATPGTVSLMQSNSDVGLAFNGIALGSYRVQWASNLWGGIWNTLLVTNVTNAGGTLQITDHGAVTNQPSRFYRVQTPP